MRDRPILRPPPFPHGRPRGGPVARTTWHTDPETTGLADWIVTQIAAARVGGSFWQVARVDREYRCLVRASSAPAAHAALERVGRGSPSEALFWLPSSRPRLASRHKSSLAVIEGDHDPWMLIGKADHVIASPEDEVALLAAAAGKPVFDPATGALLENAQLRGRLARTIEAFDYIDPFSGRPISLLDWIEILGLWRAQIDSNRRIGSFAGITGWKRKIVREFLWSDQPLRLIRTGRPRRFDADKAIALWPSRAPRHLVERAAECGIPTVRIEDGFVRSIGLGAQLHLPSSIAVDATGIYYDPSRPSDLERILSETKFEERLLDRADALIRRLVQGGVTKYSAGSGAPATLPPAARRVLVTGQVEDDLSVQLGCADVRGNLDLLRRVRDAEPDAWIAYRPHPDVVAGLRKGHVERADALRYVDMVLENGPIAGLLDQVDCVHVLTSLAGFEALLRGCEVVTHGQPFYAGWGLTRDLAPAVLRRQRWLSLREMVAGALILYPRYRDPVTRLPCPPEVLVGRHVDAPQVRPDLLNRLRTLQGRMILAGRHLGGAHA